MARAARRSKSSRRRPSSAIAVATCAITPVQYATLQQAVAVASFVPLLPSNMPGAFKQKTVVASQRDFSNPYVPQVHNDWITITYRDKDGHELLISQGFGQTISACFFSNPLFGAGPVNKTEINGHEAIWVANAPLMNGTPRGASCLRSTLACSIRAGVSRARGSAAVL